MMYVYLKERIKHAIRFRHKRGYGVHSPFMFNLILKVIRDKEKVYTYPEEGEINGNIGHKERKFYRLLYRLVTYLQVKKVAYAGDRPENLLSYLSVLSSTIEINCNKTEELMNADFVYLSHNTRSLLQGEVARFIAMAEKRRCCIVVTEIYKNGFNGYLWRQLRRRATVTIDMMWYGILIFDEKLQRGTYNLII